MIILMFSHLIIWDGVSLHNPHWPWTHDLPDSATLDVEIALPDLFTSFVFWASFLVTLAHDSFAEGEETLFQ